MSKGWLLIGACAAGTMVFAAGRGMRYGVGKPATKSEIRAYDPDVAPDGAGLPRGHGTAGEGRAVYMEKCANCHGDRGQGVGDFPPLVGGQGTLTSHNPLPTVGAYWPYATTVWDFINRAMPYQNPGSLSPNEVYSVTAYILFMNHIVARHEELNKKTLPRVKMPNRNGFVPDSRPDVK